MIENNLPESWLKISIGDISELYQPKTLSIKEIDNSGEYSVYGANGIIGKHSLYNHVSSELLITCRGATCGNVHISKPFSWINGNAMVVKPFSKELLLMDYLYFVFSTNGITSSAISGSAQPQITRVSLYPIKIPLPPLAEQKRIVEKIEELFSELDKGIETLKTAQRQLKVYRQSVLKYAFEGRLTNPEVKEGELPEGWEIIALGDIASKITDGEHITPKRTSEGIYLLSARNIQNGFLSLDNVDYIPEEEYQRIIKRCNPEENDILISCSGSIGRICKVPKNIKFTLVRSVALVKLNNEKYNSLYFQYLLLSPNLQGQIEKSKKATAQANLFLGPIKSLKVILPNSFNEQISIVQEIESRLSVCDKIEESIEQGLQQAVALRQSILKKAFEGKLVPQDPNDESASVLLERIKAERQKGQPEKKTKKVKA